MALDLEQHLKELCEQHSPVLDLHIRLERVRSSAEVIWQEQRLKWFTDHRAATHSHYIIEHLGSVLEHLQSSSERLNSHELYVLLAACYLHDIGMQDFGSIDGRSVDQFNVGDYNYIRKNHPKRARELIINRSLRREQDEFHIDLDPDTQYLVPLALVSQGHGSAFFTETVEELRNRQDRPGNEKFRGDLLTALLLMGDEIDLHERRATFPQEFALSPLSLLHHHIHHYIKGIEIVDGRTPKHRRIRLTLEFPNDASEYRADVREWITIKLVKQCNLTNPILESATKGELMWDDRIEILETSDPYGARRSLQVSPQSKSALHELRRELHKTRTVDRLELMEEIRSAIKKSRQHFQAIQVIDQENSDWSYLAKWIQQRSICSNFSYIHFAFQQSVGHGPFDILHRFSDELEHSTGYICSNYVETSLSFNEFQQNALKSLGQALLQDLQNFTETYPLVLLLERVDKAESDTLKWLIDWLLTKLSKRDNKLLVIFTQFDDEIVEDISEEFKTFYLIPYTRNQISEYLRSESGYSTEQAEKEANYLFLASSGTPMRVLISLQTKYKQRINLL